MERFVTAVSALALALCLGAGQASANIIYTFSGVTFDDGGTLTGTFTTNDTFNSLIDFNITTSPGAGGLGFHYTLGTSDSSSTSLPSIIVVNTPPLLDNILQVTFSSLTAAGSPILLGNFDSFEQHLTARRVITGGEAIVAAAVPEPSTLSMAGLGLLGIFFLRRRRAQT